MKYKIMTFRGFDYADEFQDAKNKAKKLIEEIHQDGFDSSFWWARIEDTQTEMFDYVFCRLDYDCKTTGFLSRPLK